MIRITQQSNIKCLKCLCTPENIIRIGTFYMCADCFVSEFGAETKEIRLNSPLARVYHKWLQIYLERAEDEYFDTR